mgnify:CR=1 FL=1
MSFIPERYSRLGQLLLGGLVCGLTAATIAAPSTAQSISPTAQSVSSRAQTVYKAAGGPASPKVHVSWNRYYDYQQTTGILQNLAAAYPHLARLESVGQSYGGREMWVMTISDFATGDVSHKPGFWIDGSNHANEIQATEVCTYTAWFLLEMQGENEFVQQLLRDRVFYIAPIMSPDSRDEHFYSANTTSSPRSGQVPVDDDQDGLVNEDGADDLNGDGHITQMRIRDPNGRYKEHPLYPELMIQVEDHEQGEYTLLGSEGLDNDGDGRINEDGDGSYDPNRDWAWNWQPNYIQRGAYRYPFSLKENRVIADFIRARPNIAGAQSYHNTGGMILRGPGANADAFEAADLRVYDTLGKQGEKILPGYRYLNVAKDLYEVWGGEVDWLHQMQGIFTFTNELFTSYNYFRETDGRNRETSVEFNKYLLLGDGYVKWEEVEHPLYGTVEVGGAKKNWGRQPPGFLLQEECHRNMAFTLYHADNMPMVAIRDPQVRSLGEDLWEVTVIVENTKLTPTHSAVDQRRKITRPDHVTLSGKEASVILAQTSDNFLFNRKTPHTKQPETVKLAGIGGKEMLYVRWIVRGSGDATATVDSIKGGQASLSIKLAE